MRLRAARCFGATRRAISELEDYYKHVLPATKALERPSQSGLMFPHPKTYTSLEDNTTHIFEYSTHLAHDKLIFVAREGNDNVFVKFVRQYSKEAHIKCSSMGFAPQLRGFQRVPGGWYMVIMDYLDDTYEDLDDSPFKTSFYRQIREKIESLHQAGYVHGDIRGPNMLVKKNGKGEVMLVDFDWAGLIGEVRYPMNVNRDGILRPAGAYDGNLIMADHDIEMLANIFK
jgi:serine/threonine protein kinase